VVVLPDVPGHVHKAGNWLAETTIANRHVLRLRGVLSGNMTFSQTDFTVRLPETSLTSRKRAATLRLPRPQGILGLLLAKDQDYVVRTKRPSNISEFKSVATMQVLVYDYQDENGVFLDQHYWEPCPSGGAMSLHIISMSEEQEGQEHQDETEDVMNEVLRNYPGLEYKYPRPLAGTWIDPRSPSYGSLESGPIGLIAQGEYIVESGSGRLAFAQAELEPFTLRFARLGRLGRLKRANRPIGSLWRDPDPLGDRVSNCITIATD
jgi:hypothetical protein